MIKCFGVLVLASILLVSVNRKSETAWLALNFHLTLLLMAFTVLPHELGHALAARAVRLEVFGIVIGIGSSMWRGQVFGFPVEVRNLPLSGATLFAPSTGSWVRSRIFVAILGGPLTNVAMMAACLWIAPASFAFERFGKRWAPVTALVLANGWVLVTNLVPRRVNTPLGKIWSDGAQLVMTPFMSIRKVREAQGGYYVHKWVQCRKNNEIADAKRWIEEGLVRFPENTLLRVYLATSLLDSREYDRARHLFTQALQERGVTPATRALILNDLAYSNYLTGRPDLLPEAERCSQEALRLSGWNPFLKGTRGAILTAIGRIEDGMPLLHQAFEQHTSLRAKAANAYALALGCLEQGEVANAQRWLHTACRLDPESVLRARVEQRFNTLADPVGKSGD
ncbi:MAG TPA: site-2 protease family protein [Blastocatellia bacterium]|nr:site-2 protease family protein [Blastocatellia bacterium]